ncbi:MAG: galactose oxidase-like domain-containing protein, partial [Candidatus Limnocylindrales bacterium]
MSKPHRLRAWTVALVLLMSASASVSPALAGTTGSPADPVGSTPPAAPERTTTSDAAPATAPSDTGSWGPILDWGAQAKHMTMLHTGKVLVWSTGDNARVWDPATGSFTLAPATFGDLHCAGQSTLADGRVIVVGGQNGSPHDGTNITALFDPVTQTWTRGQDMTDLRWYATSTTLADGRVLATSGDAPDGSRSTVPEIYDPTTDSWTRLTTAPRDQGLYPFMFVLPNGKVYEAGSKNTTAILDLSGTPTWTAGPTAPWSTNGYSESAVMYLPGKILRAGGGDPAHARAAVVDMTVGSPAWREIASMSFARRRMNLTILADGSVMAIGGTAAADDAAQAVLAGEIWNPTTEQWTTVESMGEARMYHSSSVLLPDGRIVVGGGEAGGRLRAQVYSPPYLFQGARPTLTSGPATAAFGSTFALTSPDAASITSLSLLRPAAATHALDMDQRYVPLAFSRSGSTLTVTAPASGGVAPPGEYMLIAKNAQGVPSIARWVRIGTAGSLQPGSISGTISNALTGDPIGGATVTTSAGTATTNGQGQYSFAGVPAGEVVVTFSAGGYATESLSATVVGGANTVLDHGMTVPGDIAGRVTSATTGNGIAGATITYPGGVTTTDAVGDYAVTGLPSRPI